MSIQGSVNSALGSLSALGVAKKYFDKQNEVIANQQESNTLIQKNIDQSKKLTEAQIAANVQKADDIENNLLEEAEYMQQYRENNPEDYEGYEELVNQIAQERPGVARIWEQQTKVPTYITENAIAQSQAVQER